MRSPLDLDASALQTTSNYASTTSDLREHQLQEGSPALPRLDKNDLNRQTGRYNQPWKARAGSNVDPALTLRTPESASKRDHLEPLADLLGQSWQVSRSTQVHHPTEAKPLFREQLEPVPGHRTSHSSDPGCEQFLQRSVLARAHGTAVRTAPDDGCQERATMNPLDRRLRTHLDALERAGLSRSPPLITARDGVRYRIQDRPVVGFCSNDYLGLSNHPSFAELPHVGSGATASRLVCGDLPEHRRVEARLAELAGTESAVLFPSGFQLNVGVLPALIEPTDSVASDALNHASLIDGLRLTRAQIDVLPHGTAPSSRGDDALSWWVTEALFSMDGDYANATSLGAHLEAGGALYLDEAHSFGLFSVGGRPTGFAGRHDLKPTVLVGTLGKAFGCAGAFVAASALSCRWIRACARSFVFSTGPSPTSTAQVEHAIDLLTGPEGDLRRQRLWTNIDRLAGHLGVAPRSPIFRIIIGENQAAMALSAALLERGWHVQAIRPPTVPRGTARLRITMTASHDAAQIDAFAADLRDLLAANS